MPAILLEGAPCPTNAEQVIQTDVDHVLSNDVDVVIAVVSDLTITLPDFPQNGQKHRIVSRSGVTTTVAVSTLAAGQGKTLTQTSVAASTYREYVFCPTPTAGNPAGQWIAQA